MLDTIRGRNPWPFLIPCRPQRGTAAKRGKPAKIVLVDALKNMDVVDAQDLAGILRSRQVMLVILQSCFSGAVDPSVPLFNGMAQALVAAGVPAVLAFRPEVRQDVARLPGHALPALALVGIHG
jgi:hypothetical protein